MIPSCSRGSAFVFDRPDRSQWWCFSSQGAYLVFLFQSRKLILDLRIERASSSEWSLAWCRCAVWRSSECTCCLRGCRCSRIGSHLLCHSRRSHCSAIHVSYCAQEQYYQRYTWLADPVKFESTARDLLAKSNATVDPFGATCPSTSSLTWIVTAFQSIDRP